LVLQEKVDWQLVVLWSLFYSVILLPFLEPKVYHSHEKFFFQKSQEFAENGGFTYHLQSMHEQYCINVL
jgi:hypothetical protein